MSFYDNEFIESIPRAKADRKRCIVCGSKKGDCTSRDYGGPDHIVTLSKSTTADGRVAADDEIIIEEDIWQDVEISPGVMSKTLVARAGLMKKKKAKDLGII